MRLKYAMLTACIMLALVSGCSREEPGDFSDKRTRIRMPIEKSPSITAAEEGSAKPKEKISPDEAVRDQDRPLKRSEPVETIVEKTGIYTTKKGDTLSGVSAMETVYGNPLKWPFLYRHNRKLLSGIARKENLPFIELSEKLPLKIITPDAFEKNLKSRPRDYEVINVVSSTEMEKIVPYAVNLMDNDYLVYITEAEIEGKIWLRLRVGFYHTRGDARKTGEKIKALIDIPDVWVTTVGDIEFGEFGGY